MGTRYNKENISPSFFKSLKSFRRNYRWYFGYANNKQIVLAKNINRSYSIELENILELILYADIALGSALWSEEELYYTDKMAVEDFEKEPLEPILKITFNGITKSLEITNPTLIENLYKSMFNWINLPLSDKGKGTKKKRSSGTIIKKVATELYIELSEKEKITGSRPLYIIGYIFSLCKVGLKREEPILTEKEHNAQNEIKKSKGITTESYLSYLSGHMKRYINWKLVNSTR